MDNLRQMIRILKTREDTSLSELVLVCQDKTAWKPNGFASVQCLSLQLPMYQKPVLCNRGVQAASNPIIALLDSDRVLPKGWFSRTAGLVRPREIRTTLNLAWCLRSYTDEEIESNTIELVPDIKCPDNSLLRKNAFSGNTVMFREDYLSVGGMDEQFVGYGFADNDMVENCRSKGMKFIYSDEPEIHLHHDKFVVVGDKELPRTAYRSYTLLNGLRFCLKWKKPITPSLMELLRCVRRDNSPFIAEIERLVSLFKVF